MATERETEVKVKIRRVKGKDPATCISYTKGGGMEQWHPEEGKDEFDVPVLVAFFAIKEGFFEQHPKSKVKLKTNGGQVLPVAEEAAPLPSDNQSNAGGEA